MVVKRRKIGNTTITINTSTGRQTTSRRSGNITHSQSNQGHTRSTVTTNYGNGWFDRKTTNWNKKGRKKKSEWSWFADDTSSKSTSNSKKVESAVKEEKPVFVGPPFPVFYKRKTFKQFTLFEWIKWFAILPFRVLVFTIFWGFIIGVCVKILQFIISVI
jgi:hypothetical protein